MQMLMVVLNRVECLNDLLDAFMEQGISGATVLKSNGMVKLLANNEEQYPIVGSLRHLLNDNNERKHSRTVFMVLPDERMNDAKQVVRNVVGDLSKPDTAIMLTIPILTIEGVDIQ